jgi:hypothetical protein
LENTFLNYLLLYFCRDSNITEYKNNMKTKKVLVIFACLMSAALLYVFGSMYVTNKDQAGGGSSTSNTGNSSQTGGAAANTSSPGNNGSSAQQSAGANQSANPTSGAAQENIVPGIQQQSVPLPTQPVNTPRQTSSGSTGINLQQQSQNNSVNNSQPQITQNPAGGIQ